MSGVRQPHCRGHVLGLYSTLLGHFKILWVNDFKDKAIVSFFLLIMFYLFFKINLFILITG